MAEVTTQKQVGIIRERNALLPFLINPGLTFYLDRSWGAGHNQVRTAISNLEVL